MDIGLCLPAPGQAQDHRLLVTNSGVREDLGPQPRRFLVQGLRRGQQLANRKGRSGMMT
jgi:hypothetical protein